MYISNVLAGVSLTKTLNQKAVYAANMHLLPSYEYRHIWYEVKLL